MSTDQQPQQQLPSQRQASYEAAELAEDRVTLVTTQTRQCNGGRAAGSGGGGGCYGVIGVALCAFVLGCLLSFAATLLATRAQVGGDCSGRGSAGSSDGVGAWPDERQLRANRARLRALAASPAELDGHVAALSRRQSRAGTNGSQFHADYVAKAWISYGLQVINRTYSVPLSYLDTDAVPQDQIGVFLCSGGSENLCDERLPLDLSPLTPEDAVDGAPLHSLVPYTEPLDGSFRLLTQEQLSELAAGFAGNAEQLRKLLADTVVLVDAGMDIGGSSLPVAMSDVPNATVLSMAAGLLKKLAPEPRPGVPTYPKGTGVPDSLIWMKSTLGTNIKGDPTTPLYPSKLHAVRTGMDPEPPSQPTVPLSAADAARLRRFAAAEAAATRVPRVRIRWPMRTGLRPVRDVCTEMRGSVEPDRVVLIGGHRDAWHSGALDPHSGLSSLLVISRALADLQRQGWRPRRTLLVCTWDAEEWNLIGSAEWLDEEIHRANRRLVAYVNTDTDVMGNWKVMVHAFRRWHGFLDELIAEVPNPDPSGDPLYHFYKAPDAYSDYYVFWRNLGVPIVDLSYIRPNETRMVVYDLYHSRYDTVRLYRLTDPGGRAHLATVRNYLGIVYTLLDSPLIPVNLTGYAEEIEGAMLRLYGHARVAGWARAAVDRGSVASSSGSADDASIWPALEAAFSRELRGAVRALRRFEAVNLTRLREAGQAASPMQLRMVNDKLMEVQRAFVYRSVYPRQDLVNLMADESSISSLFASAFNDDFGEVSSDINLAGKLVRMLRLQKLIETCILSLASVPKILSDDFAD